MDSISEIEEVNHYLITGNWKDKIRRGVQKLRNKHSAESELKAQQDQSEKKQNSLERQINNEASSWLKPL